MMFYSFDQNNSGGRFDFDEDVGITRYVVIEADSEDHANQIAEELGIYFDGVDKDLDCDCCGDRWCRTYGGGDQEPCYYGKPIDKIVNSTFKWMPKNKEACVHYLDGRKEWY